MNLRVFPNEFNQALRKARTEGSPLHVIEESSWGCNHADTGSLLASKWSLTPALADVIQYHHCLPHFAVHRTLIALVSLCDQMCRTDGLGHGYPETGLLQWENNDLIDILRTECPAARSINWPQASLELKSYLNDVRKLVSVLFRLC